MKAQHDGLLCAAVLLTWLVGTGCNDSKASAASASTALADPVGSCGKKGLPDCPLQEWMKANLQADLSSGDTTRLATALDELATKAPAGYGSWKREAESAARAARAGNLAAVKVACKQCHDELRSKFRAEMRTARLF
jgi:hypothetical protein